jgi:hypothetical protein
MLFNKLWPGSKGESIIVPDRIEPNEAITLLLLLYEPVNLIIISSKLTFLGKKY